MKNSSPPKVFLRFFKWFCRHDRHKYVEGDLLELYQERIQKVSKRKANIRFAMDILLLFRPSIIRPFKGFKSSNYYGLLQHNVLITFRVISRDRLYSVLNILGLALGIAAFIFIFQYVRFEKSFDQFHKNNPDLYRINYQYFLAGELQRSVATVPPAIAPLIKASMPEVNSFVRFADAGDGVIEVNGNKFLERNILFADPDFFKMFSFPLVSGDINSCLRGIRKMVLTETMARKYFKNEDPLGQFVTVDGAEDRYTITGVVKDPPANSHIQFDFLISYWWYEENEETNWYQHYYHSYLWLQPYTDIAAIEAKFQQAIENKRGKINKEGNFIQQFTLQPMPDIHFNAHLEGELIPVNQGDKFTIDLLLLIGWLILVIAWVNYVNLSTARAIKRAREVGVRKTLGAHRYQLFFQFIFESLALNFLGVILALPLVTFSIGYFNKLGVTSLSLDFFWNSSFWAITLIGWMLGSLIAGLYPAFVLSSFKPASVLKSHSIIVGSGGWLRKLLVVFQFATSVALIIGTAVIYKQLDYMKNKDIGFDPDNIMVIRGPISEEGAEDLDKHKVFIDKLSQFAQITNVTVTNVIPGEVVDDPVYVRNENDPDEASISYDVFWVGYDYVPTFDLKLIEGRDFDPKFPSDSLAVILNAKGANLLGFYPVSQIIGQTVSLNGAYPRTVIGVVEDFNQLTSKHPVSPMVLGFDPNWGHYYVIKYIDNHQSVIQEAETIFQSLYPRDAFHFFFLDEFYNQQYITEDKMSRVFTLFSGLAIFIACLGLFGLASYNTLRRTKEIGVRKVFGAGLNDIVYLLSKEFTLLVVFSNIVTWPVVYYIMNEWLNNFASRINIGFLVFLISGLAVLCLALLTVGSTIMKIVRLNPIHALKDE